MFADNASTATGARLSTKSEREHYDQERRRKTRKAGNFADGEKAESVEIYEQRGYSEQDARQLVEILSRTKQHWIDTMMFDELGLTRDDRNPMFNGLATLAAFVVAGAVPLLVYLAGLFVTIENCFAFIVSLVLSGLALFGLGAAKVLITGGNALRSGLEMFFGGGLAAAVAYATGALLQNFGGQV